MLENWCPADFFRPSSADSQSGHQQQVQYCSVIAAFATLHTLQRTVGA